MRLFFDCRCERAFYSTGVALNVTYVYLENSFINLDSTQSHLTSL